MKFGLIIRYWHRTLLRPVKLILEAVLEAIREV